MPIALDWNLDDEHTQKVRVYYDTQKGKCQMEKSFNQTVSDIEKSEKAVDRVLKAARLSRNPVDRTERLGMVLGTIVALTGLGFLTISMLIIGGVF